MTAQSKIAHQAEVLNDLHARFTPHRGQIAVANALFYQGKKLIMVDCGRKWGKDLALDSDILTPSGFVKLSTIKSGDEIYDGNGVLTRVSGMSEIRRPDICYRITFNDGTTIDASDTHRWITVYGRDRKEKVVTTQDIYDRTLLKSYKYRPTLIPLCGKIEFEKKDLKIDPYILGLWLGNGNSADGGYTTNDLETIDSIREHYTVNKWRQAYGYGIIGLSPLLRQYGLIGKKFIPSDYLMSSVEDRISLLAGLMDTDGHITKKGACEFTQKSNLIFNGFIFLLKSLGIRLNSTEIKIVNGGCYNRAKFTPNFNVFRLKRKADRFINIGKKTNHKTIVKVERIESVKMRCLSVESNANTYITNNFTVTHNTESIAYIAYRFGMSYPESIIYIIGPFIKQMREIIWSDGRITHFLGKNTEADKAWIVSRTQQDLRVTFTNGSFIKLDGADNYEAFRGPNPHLVLYDEFKDHHPKFDEGMRPNLLSHNAPLVVVGTPPDCEEAEIKTEETNPFYQFMNECKDDPDGAYFNMPTYINPHIKIEDLKKIERRYRNRGEYHVFQREYLAMHISSSNTHIFPMFDRNKHVRSYSSMLVDILKSPKSYDFYISFDPATTSTFAGLLVAIHRDSKIIYVMDEIYKTTPNDCVTRVVFGESITKWRGIWEVDDDWFKLYDYAAAWFAAEVNDLFDYGLTPCEKDLKNKENKISMIKDIILNGYFFISDRCVNTIKEIANYKKDEKGKILKVDDHNIDNLRYILNAARYTTTSFSRYTPADPDIRGHAMETERQKDVESDAIDGWLESFIEGDDI